MSATHELTLPGDWVIRDGSEAGPSIRRLSLALGGGALVPRETTGSGRATECRWTSSEGATLRVRSHAVLDATSHAFTLTLADGAWVSWVLVDTCSRSALRIVFDPAGRAAQDVAHAIRAAFADFPR